MATKILYVMDCPDGKCEIDRKGTELVQRTTGERRICKEHGGRLVGRTRNCNNPDCNEKFYGSKSSEMSLCCKKCRTLIRTLKSRRNRVCNKKDYNLIDEQIKRVQGYNEHKNKNPAKKKRVVVDGRSKLKDDSGCLNFKEFCRNCIMPHFDCKMYSPG